MIVLDCSAAVEIVRETEAGKALQALMLSGEKTVASDLYLIELASAFRKYVKAELLSEKEALLYIEEAAKLVDDLVPLEENYQESFHESLRLDHSPYDMLYLTLARRNAATLFTFDSRLREICEKQGVECVHQASL